MSSTVFGSFYLILNISYFRRDIPKWYSLKLVSNDWRKQLFVLLNDVLNTRSVLKIKSHVFFFFRFLCYSSFFVSSFENILCIYNKIFLIIIWEHSVFTIRFFVSSYENVLFVHKFFFHLAFESVSFFTIRFFNKEDS